MNRDPELEELLGGDPELAAVADQLRAARPRPDLDPRFGLQLRARLMAQAAHDLRPRHSRWWHMPTGVAWVGAAAGAAAAAAVLINLVNSHPHDRVTFVTATSPQTGQPAVTADLITVSFTEPMNQSAVVAGLRIQPATAIRATWRGNDLQIAPLHHLSPNTPYTLTIDEASARAAGGGVVKGGVHIAFGTAPKPAPTPAPVAAVPPPLTLTALGQVAGPSRILFGPDNSVLATRGIVPPAPTPTPPASPAAAASGAASPSPATSPAAAAAATPTATPTAAPATPVPPVPGLTRFAADGRAQALGPAANTVAPAPDGKHIAAAVPAAGGVDIMLGATDAGTAPAVITHSDTPSTDLAWSAPNRLLFVSGGQINAVDLTGSVQTVTSIPSGAPVLLAPNGLSAIVLPGPGSTAAGALVDLVSRSSREMKGSQAVAAYSPTGRTIAWFDGSGITVSPAALDQPVGVPLPPSTGAVTALAVSDDAGKLAYTTTATLVAQVPSGRIVAAGNGTNPAFSAAGDRLALVVPGASPSTFSVATAPLAPPANAPPPAPVPPDAATTLDRFVQAQVHSDTATLIELSGGDQSLVGRTPRGLTRGNITAATTRDDGSVTALVELIEDPSADHPASLSLETLSLELGGPGGYTVTKVTMTPLAVQPPGPHVVTVQPDARDLKAVDVVFDSDLAAATVPGAVTLRTHAGAVIAATVTYNADTRTATISPRTGGTGEVDVGIAISLTDITGQHLAGPFVTTVRRG